MKIEEAIETLEEKRKYCKMFYELSANPQEDYPSTAKFMDALELALTALRSMPEVGEYHLRDATKMVPLSLEQLKQMNGKPVWVVCLKKEKYIAPPIGWRILEKSFSGSFGVWNGENCLSQRSYGSDWLAYSYPPAHIDRSKWEPCEHCKPSDYPPDRWGAHEFPVVGNEIYFYDTEYGWEGEEIKYCPWCGRPLTEEAWAELERRLRG